MATATAKERESRVKTVAFDSDGHLTEPPQIFEEYIDPMYRPRVKRLGLEYSAAGGLAGGTIGKYEDVVDPEKAKGMKGHPGGYDPRARLRVFQEEGYYGAVLYPSAMLRWYHDPFLWTAMATAYNRWTGEEFCSADRSRLHAAVAVNLEDVRGAVSELTRCVKQYGSRAVAVRPNATAG